MAFTPIPAIPYLMARVDLRWGSSTNAMVSSLWYSLQNVVTSFSMTTFGTSFRTTVITPGFMNIICPQIVMRPAWAFVNWDGTVHSQSTGLTGAATQPNPFIADFLCPIWTKFTFVGGRNFTGRCYGPGLPKSFVGAGGNYTPAAVAALENTGDIIASPFISQGVLFLPVVWSPSTGSFAQISACGLFGQPAVRRSRVVIGHRPSFFYNYPIVP